MAKYLDFDGVAYLVSKAREEVSKLPCLETDEDIYSLFDKVIDADTEEN